MTITTEEAENWKAICGRPSSVCALVIRSLAAERDALKAEVERIKAGGCARDQSTTQFCAEAAAVQAENARLREVLKRAKQLFLQDEPQGAFIEVCAALGEKNE
jgi:hypothetical protein